MNDELADAIAETVTRRKRRNQWLMWSVVWLAFLMGTGDGTPTDTGQKQGEKDAISNIHEGADKDDRQKAHAKCRYIWQKICERQGTPERFEGALADHFVDEHYAAGHEGFWFYSLCYCWSGSGLLKSMENPPAYGLVDTWFSTHAGNESYCTGLLKERGINTWDRRVLLDPYIATRLHCIEVTSHWHNDDPLRTLRGIFLPANPNGARTKREQRERWNWRLKMMISWAQKFERDYNGQTAE